MYDPDAPTLLRIVTALGPGVYGVIVTVSVDDAQLMITNVNDCVLTTE